MPANAISVLPKGRRRRPDASREAILKWASIEFANEGLSGARMDAIARSAGVNKALLYYYFHDKDSLYRAVLDQFFQPLFQQLIAALDSSASAGQRILDYARAHFDSIAETPHYARLFQGEMMSAGRGVSPHLSEIVDRYTRPLSQQLMVTLSDGVANGEFRKIDVFQFIPSMVATIVFYFVTAPVLRQLRGFEPFSPEAIQARRAAVLDQIAAALFADRDAGLCMAAAIAAEGELSGDRELVAAKPHHRVPARRRK